jgi:hypothetical protein
MRISGLAVISPLHIPPSDRDAIAALIDAPCVTSRRTPLSHHGIVIEAHAFGAFINTGLVVDDDKPAHVSDALWTILEAAESQGCDWVLVDRDEPPSDRLPRFD